MPASLQAAIASYWASAGLASSVAPYHELRIPPGAACPLVLLADVVDDLPGETDDTRPVRGVWHCLSDRGMAEARALGGRLLAAIGPGSSRSPLAWDGGVERFPELYDAFALRRPRRGRGNRPLYAYAVHLTFWINGTP